MSLNHVSIINGRIAAHSIQKTGMFIEKSVNSYHPVTHLFLAVVGKKMIKAKIEGKKVRYLNEKSAYNLVAEFYKRPRSMADDHDKKLTLKTFSGWSHEKKLEELQKAYDGRTACSPKEIEFWEYRSIENLRSIDFSMIDKTQFDAMKRAYGNIALSEVLKHLSLEQLNYLYPFFTEKSYWQSIHTRVPELDLSKMTQKNFQLMRESILPAFLLQIKPAQVNHIYNYFTKDQWRQLALNEQIAQLDFKHMSSSAFEAMFASGRINEILEALKSEQVALIAIHIQAHHKADLTSKSKEILQGIKRL